MAGRRTAAAVVPCWGGWLSLLSPKPCNGVLFRFCQRGQPMYGGFNERDRSLKADILQRVAEATATHFIRGVRNESTSRSRSKVLLRTIWQTEAEGRAESPKQQCPPLAGKSHAQSVSPTFFAICASCTQCHPRLTGGRHTQQLLHAHGAPGASKHTPAQAKQNAAHMAPSQLLSPWFRQGMTVSRQVSLKNAVCCCSSLLLPYTPPLRNTQQ